MNVKNPIYFSSTEQGRHPDTYRSDEETWVTPYSHLFVTVKLARTPGNTI